MKRERYAKQMAEKRMEAEEAVSPRFRIKSVSFAIKSVSLNQRWLAEVKVGLSLSFCRDSSFPFGFESNRIL